MSVHDDLNLYLRARVPMIVLVTVEEQRALEILNEVRVGRDASAKSDLVMWDVARGLVSRDGRSMPTAPTPDAALDKIAEMARDNPNRKDLYVLKDFHEFWHKSPAVKRKLRNLAHGLVSTYASLVVTTHSADVPAELGDDVVVLDMPLPGLRELRHDLDELIRQTRVECDLTHHGRWRLAQAALGLTATQARRAFSKAIVRDKVLDELDIPAVLEEKKAVIRASQALEYYSAEETLEDVGGLELLKEWLTLRESAFGEDAAKFGLPAPKGMALIGIPGTGKSLTAKMISGLWRLPLLRLDVGALFGSLVGESEERLRRALKITETVSPCVLWIDELEKSMASGGLDGGTSQRVFGTILTWMQEKTAPVFVVATANDVGALPPETLRRGRFDEVFFLDLPTDSERREILNVHLRKRLRDPAAFDVMRLARLSDGYVGAEIEQAIVDALYRAFADGPRDITTDDVAAAIDRLVPLSRSQRERIEDLRSWLRDGRAQSASFAEASQAAEHQVRLELA
ncbi:MULTISPECIES: AAA family ATPase [Actinomadura]|uniref:AAA family ATPase n=1 Tax=Actinomadura TaxID=1988 RepID=UPI0003FD7D06|nr:MULTISPECIES: AAA family ATPase [Actinomadura]RSN60028.1 AAA family ATPase [Actinomadura sp. WAC 06369]